jgi:hypothetical protein
MPSPKRRQKTGDFVDELQTNPVLSAMRRVANMDNYKLPGTGKRARAGQASNLKASDYGNQKPYIAPGSNWDTDKSKAKKTTKSSGLGGHKGS